ncbi:acyl-CoA dehydrogenase [candidate division TA06 bacterium B3_TA06]|uniref:Acyl-CoA dehydrogenase n=1 Tax=candidate division TA06 bacterium B3_TA06 TaxID=2012487 RepID=A0A532V8Z2_UNCT6|nr:MAG: acyl-CoA dehydrogenase [candidate division TA06 bacterium B3_TA06]
MDYFLTEEQVMIRDLARKIAEEKVKPVRAELDEKGEFPEEIMKELARADLLRVFVPEEAGGLGGGCMEMCIVAEELSRICAGVATTYAANGLACMPIILYGTEEQKQRFLPRIADGASYAAFALTEAEAGSDAANIKTTAKETDDGFVINGTKQFITNGGVAEIYTVIAVTDPKRGARGVSALVVEKGTPGFEFGKEEDKMGIRASKTTQLIFSDCKIPKENLLGKRGMGFIITLKTFDRTRPGVGAQAVGIAQGAFDEALAYGKGRVQFGKPITSFQGIQFMLADMATQIEAARALVYATARMIDAGAKDFAKESAMAKLFASDMAMSVTTDAVQIMGGYGYMREYPAEKYMRDAKITQIYEGTNQIQRQVIANALIK